MTTYTFLEIPNTSGKIIDSITLTSSDYLSFPTFFAEKHKLKEIDEKLYLHLFYDKRKMAVAIQFSTKKSGDTYPVNGPEQYGATCKIKSFLLRNDINAELYKGRYEYKKVAASELGLEGEALFIIELTKNAESLTDTEEKEM